MEPDPNYYLTMDRSDLRQLTDGKTHSYPIWTKRESVGWNSRTPVKIAVNLSCNGDAGSRLSGTLRLLTAKGTPANGVNVPRRIDVYALEKPGAFAHVGFAQMQQSAFSDKSNHWISVNVRNASSDIVIVLHAENKFLMLDEIAWKPETKAVTSSQNKDVPYVDDVVKDSISRLKDYLRSKAGPQAGYAGAWSKEPNPEALRVWIQDPWVPLEAYPTPAVLRKARQKFDVTGVDQEYESASLGLLSIGADSHVRVSVLGLPDAANVIQLRKVDRVLAADGSMVFDPLIPIPEGYFALNAGEASYVMLTMDLKKLDPGIHEFQIKVEDRGEKNLILIPGQIRVIRVPRWSAQVPRAVTWAYMSDLPIWRQKEAVLEDLVSHGVNVFVIHPAALPRPNLGGASDTDRMARFARELNFFKGHGTILLFLRWSDLFEPLESVPLEDQKRAIQGWTSRLSRELVALGLKNSDWALYPIDEPRGNSLSLLKKVVPWIKEVDNAIRIYANPISHAGGVTHIADLRWLDQYIDIWQPAFNFASRDAHSFFSTLEKEWWVYNNPWPPAKSEAPSFYRLLAADAWRIGAKGVGFWAYSDTRGSSAWDDFDGMTPDWAVVYEGEEGPISSRRWEAFREGVEDFRLFEQAVAGAPGYCKTSRHDLRQSVRRIAETRAVDGVSFDAIRSSILQPGCNVE